METGETREENRIKPKWQMLNQLTSIEVVKLREKQTKKQK